MTKINCVDVVSGTISILWTGGLLSSGSYHIFQVTKLALHFIINTFIAGVLILNIINGIKTGNGMLSYRMICILIPEINLTVKGLTLLKNKKCFISILEDLNSDTFNVHSKKLNKHVQVVNKISELILRYFMIIMGTFLLIAGVLPIITNIKMLIPNPIQSGKFEFTYRIAHLLFTTYMAINSASLDVLYVSLIGLCTAQLNILEARLINIFKDRNKYEPNKNFKVKHTIVLRECIILHETINTFVRKLSTLLSLPLSIQYAGGCFIICNAILQITIMDVRGAVDIIILVVYVAVTFSQMTIYHWLGNEIIFKSNKILDSCYLSKWYEMEKSSKTSLLVLMERAKRPLAVKVYNLISISLESLVITVRWSYSLFAVIRARYGQN